MFRLFVYVVVAVFALCIANAQACQPPFFPDPSADEDYSVEDYQADRDKYFTLYDQLYPCLMSSGGTSTSIQSEDRVALSVDEKKIMQEELDSIMSLWSPEQEEQDMEIHHAPSSSGGGFYEVPEGAGTVNWE